MKKHKAVIIYHDSLFDTATFVIQISEKVEIISVFYKSATLAKRAAERIAKKLNIKLEWNG